MPKGTITMQIKDFQKLSNAIAKMDEQGRKAIKQTVRDIKVRAPAWVADEVTAVYNIKKSEIIPQKDSKPKRGRRGTKSKRRAGTIRVTGETIADLAIVYTGRMLTPVHFGMIPKVPSKGRNYTIRMQVYKGHKEVIGRYKARRTRGGPFSEKSHNILMGTGNTRKGGISHIPFQRVSRNRKDIEKFLTTSVPEMVDNEYVHGKVLERLNAETSKRLDHYLERGLCKWT